MRHGCGIWHSRDRSTPYRSRKEFDFMTIRVVIADDHVLLRQGLRALLENESDMRVVGEANNGLEAVDLVLETEPNVLLIGVMSEIDGMAATRVVHERSPRTRVVVLSQVDGEAALEADHARVVSLDSVRQMKFPGRLQDG